MAKLERPYFQNNTKHLAISLISAVFVLLILESKGLVVWAERLEAGTLQNLALPATQSWQKLVSPLAIGDVREPLVKIAHTDHLWQKLTEDAPPAKATTPIATAPATPPTVPPTTAAAPTPVAVSSPDFANIAVPLATTLPQTLNQLNQQNHIQIALVGDSMMAVGLSASIQQAFGKDDKLHFVKAFRSGTGLSRPDVFNWLDEYPKMIGNHTPHLIFVAIGANDAQDFAHNGKVVHYGTNEWFALYKDRLDNFVQMITQHNAHIVWLGLPAMRASKFDKKVDLMNRFVYQALKPYPNITWINPNPLLSTNNAFLEFGKNAVGKTVRLRSQDGIHILDDGAKLLLPTLFSWYQQPQSQPQP